MVGQQVIHIHQSQLRGLRHSYLPRHPDQRRLQSFTEWLDSHVGQQDRDWGCIYDLNLGRPTYGTTWWVLDPVKATLVMLKWG